MNGKVALIVSILLSAIIPAQLYADTAVGITTSINVAESDGIEFATGGFGFGVIAYPGDVGFTLSVAGGFVPLASINNVKITQIILFTDLTLGFAKTWKFSVVKEHPETKAIISLGPCLHFCQPFLSFIAGSMQFYNAGSGIPIVGGNTSIQ